MQLQALDDRESVRDAIRVHGRAWRAAYAELLPERVLAEVTVEPDPADVDDWLERLPAVGDPALARAVTVRDAVRGYAFVRWGRTKEFVRAEEAGLKELYVDPDWWGGGLGTSLLGQAVSEIPPEVDGVALETLVDNDRGRRFYEARGFEADGYSELEIGGDSYETVVYRRAR
jgi:GNAT superfamily N-acetyltransferase